MILTQQQQRISIYLQAPLPFGMHSFPQPLPPLERADEFFATRHGYRLCSSRWMPPPGVTLRGAVLFVHGYTDYIGPVYDQWASLLGHQGFACFGVEHHGHGRSDGLQVSNPFL